MTEPTPPDTAPSAATPPDTSPSSGAEDVAYHLVVTPEEAAVATTALRLLISDEAGEGAIRNLARSVIAGLAENSDPTITVALSAPELKIAHTAVKLLFDDLGREQGDERRLLRQILEKLPDEHAIRAIALDPAR